MKNPLLDKNPNIAVLYLIVSDFLNDGHFYNKNVV